MNKGLVWPLAGHFSSGARFPLQHRPIRPFEILPMCCRGTAEMTTDIDGVTMRPRSL